MPYIDRNQRPLYDALLREIRGYPAWRSPDENSVLMDMLFSWLKIRGKENPLKRDGDINFICTWMLKHTHRTYHTPDEHKTKIWNPLDKEVSSFVREVLTKMFEMPRSYSSYERLYGLLSLMEAEFERRGWSLGRKDLKIFFITEKRYWRKRVAEYEDIKIQENGDVE
jgi:hypothetical protein